MGGERAMQLNYLRYWVDGLERGKSFSPGSAVECSHLRDEAE